MLLEKTTPQQLLKVDICEPEDVTARLRYEAPSINLSVEVDRLEVGDYCYSNVLGIERKAHDDFLGSIGERLFTQAHELAANFQTPVILVTSTMSRLCAEKPPEVIRGFIASLTVREGVRVLLCGSDQPWEVPDDPVPMILKLMQKATTPTSRVYNPIRRGGSKSEYGVGLIAALPGMGMKRASKVVAHFGTPLESLVNVDRWSEIEGIGDKTITRVLEVLTNGAENPTTEVEE